jgi:hypothetical protein
VIAQHVEGLAVGDALEVLEEADAQEDDGLDGGAARAGGIGGLDLGAGGDDAGEDEGGEEAVAIGLGEEGGGGRATSSAIPP